MITFLLILFNMRLLTIFSAASFSVRTNPFSIISRSGGGRRRCASVIIWKCWNYEFNKLLQWKNTCVKCTEHNLIPTSSWCSKWWLGEDPGEQQVANHKAHCRFETVKIANIFGYTWLSVCQGLLQAAMKTLWTKLNRAWEKVGGLGNFEVTWSAICREYPGIKID